MVIKSNSVKEEVLPNGAIRKIKGYIDDLMIAELKLKKGMVGDIHTHIHSQCAYVLSGSFECEIDGKKEIISVGDCFYVTPNVPHGLVALEDDSTILDIFTPKRDDFL